MKPTFYGHPFSSYTQKALIALYEHDIAFEWRMLDPDHPENVQTFEALWPLKRFPLLVDGDRTVPESTTIIEYLDLYHAGARRLLPAAPDEALEARMLDRFFDNYVHVPMQKIVFNALRPKDDRDPYGVDAARAQLDKAYAWLDRRMDGRTWAVGDGFSLADCSAAPALFYAEWAHPMPERLAHIRAYRARLLQRSSFARAVDEARPYRPYFPLGAPDRD